MSDGRRSPSWGTGVLIGGLVIVGLALRLPSFGDSMWGDELSTNFVVHGFGVGDPISIVRGNQEGTPPLFFLLAWLTKGIDRAEGLRIVSLIAGLGAIPLTYLVGTRTVGSSASLVAALLLALSPFQIYYATEARAYSLMMFFTLAATLMLLVALERGRAGWWVAYALSVAAAAYTHYTSVFVLIALFGWAFIARPEGRRPLVLATAGAVVLFLPWVPELLDDRHEPAGTVIEMIHPLTLTNARIDLGQWSIGHPLFGVSEVPGTLGIVLILLGLGVGAVALLIRLAKLPNRGYWPPAAGIVLVVLLALATPVGAVIHNAFAPSVFLNRNLIASWPGLALSAGALVTAGRMPLRVVAIGSLVAGFAIGAVKMLDSDHQRPDFDAAARFIERTGNPGAPVVEVPEPTPGPQTALEAALAAPGQPLPTDRHVFTLGLPSSQTRFAVVRRGGALSPVLPVPSPKAVAQQAARAAHGGTLFVVAADLPLEQLRAFPGQLSEFLAALPPQYHEVETRGFSGLSIFHIGVHVLEGSGSK
jgi:hypothetical protein